tara:strand:+ start:207 stop:485 length:279 start_codon:yes stop_codon:yes gene_type:complete
MTLLAGYLLLSFSSLLAFAFFINACDEYAAQLSESPMTNQVSELNAFKVRHNKPPTVATIVDRNRQLFVDFPDGRSVKCHNLATARAVVRQG